MTAYTKWTDKEVREWAYEYVADKRNTLDKLERRLGVSHSTLWWCFQHRLHNKTLAGRVMKQLYRNAHKGGRR